MQRHEGFLELVHRHLSLPGTSVHSLGCAIDEYLDACGDTVPRRVVAQAIEIRTALARGGIVEARLRLETARRGNVGGRVSGVFEGLYPAAVRVAAGADVRHSLLKFEVDDQRVMQLLSLDGPRPQRVGQPRHVALFDHVVEKGPTSLFDAIRASGTSATRGENVYYEIREAIGGAWFQESGYGSRHARMIRVVRPAGCRLFREHVVTLTETRPARRER